MPTRAHREGKGRPVHQKPDFVRSNSQPWNVAPFKPNTREEIRNYLEDIGASALAAANQFVDPECVHEIYDDMAMRVAEDVAAQLYPLHVAILRQQYSELGRRQFSYVVNPDGSEVIEAS